MATKSAESAHVDEVVAATPELPHLRVPNAIRPMPALTMTTCLFFADTRMQDRYRSDGAMAFV
jgi:hypothetical protein